MALGGRGRTVGKVLSIMLMVGGLVAMGFGLFTFGDEQKAVAKYEELAQVSDPTATTDPGDGTPARRDWAELRAINPDVAAWVTIGNTPIDYPVMQPGKDKPEGYYLHHDMWGNRSSVGTPYLEDGSTAEGQHSLVYGHHLGMTQKMFSPVSQTYKQDVFDGLGDMTWDTPEGTHHLVPLFAMKVDMSYQPIQEYSFKDDAKMHEWLTALSKDASAFSEGWEDKAAHAKKVVTTVACSSLIAGQRPRTLTVFVEV